MLSSRLNKRVAILKAMEKAVEEVRDKITYSCEDSYEILRWIKEIYPSIFGDLHKSDSAIMNRLISGLGKTDRVGQQKFCEGLLRSIERNLKDAERESGEKSRLYTTLGLSFGLAISIIIF